MVLSLNYRDLSSTVSGANNLANELSQYCEDLSRKVQQKMYSVEGGMSTALNSADYYVNQKITQLRARETNARTLSSKAQTLLNTAKRVDEDVKSTIEANQMAFFQKNPDLKPSDFKQKWTSFMCDLKNVPILGGLIGAGETVADALDQLGKDIKNWWKCGGGKELVMNCLDIAVKIGMAAAAVVTAVGAVTALVAAIVAGVVTGGLVIFAVAAVVAAAIAVVNAVTNTVTSVQAIAASSTGNPAMAKIYGKRDTLAQVLRETNFHDKKKNRASNAWATGLEVTDAIAGVVLIAQSIGKITGSFLSNHGVGFAFKELARNADGKLTTKVTLNSIWKGTKALVLNQKLTSSTSAGLRTTLLHNIKQSMGYQATLFKMAMRDPGRWIKTKQVGDLGFFKNIAENMRYGFWQLKNTAFQFRAGDFKANLGKISTLVNTTNDIFGNIKLVINGIERSENKGLLRRLSEKYVQKTFFDNDFITVLDKTGAGGLITGLDQSGIIGDFTGIDKGIIQKIIGMKRSLTFSPPFFRDQFPYYECAVAGSGN